MTADTSRDAGSATAARGGMAEGAKLTSGKVAAAGAGGGSGSDGEGSPRRFAAGAGKPTSPRVFGRTSPVAGVTGSSRAYYHTTESGERAASVLEGFDESKLNDRSRFGVAFYVSEDPLTTQAKLKFHKKDGSHTIRFSFSNEHAKILDLTNPATAAEWGYYGGEPTDGTRNIGEKAKVKGYNVIRFRSERGPGSNLAILSDY